MQYTYSRCCRPLAIIDCLHVLKIGISTVEDGGVHIPHVTNKNNL